MKHIKQILIILGVSFLGELLKMILPFPVPASIYGLALMFLALVSGIVSLTQVKETADFLIEIMPLMFIPAGVGLMTSWSVLSSIIVPVILITLLSTVIVMAVTGKITQKFLQIQNKETKEKSISKSMKGVEQN